MSVPDGKGFAYLDASALVKLVIREPERDALRHHLTSFPRRASSELAVAELVRVVRRHNPARESDAVAAIRVLGLLRLDRRLMAEAAAIPPPTLGTLDAIHLATALRLHGAIESFVTYDRALAGAASDLALPVASPA